jgi:hypothetical protein
MIDQAAAAAVKMGGHLRDYFSAKFNPDEGMNIVDIFKGAREKRKEFEDKYNSFMQPVTDALAGIEQAKEGMVSQPMRDIGFGNPMAIEQPAFQPVAAPGALDMMGSTMGLAGISNPAAGMLRGPTPMMSPAELPTFVPQPDTYVDPIIEAAAAGQVQPPVLIDPEEEARKAGILQTQNPLTMGD